MLSLILASALSAPPPPPAEKPLKPLPSLAKEPKLDGELKDFVGGQPFKMPEAATGASAGLKVQAAWRNGALYVAVQVQDDAVTTEDQLELTLYFPESGTTSRGFVYRFGTEGKRAPSPESGPPEFAAKLVKAGAKLDKKGWAVEAAFPARALPRFQAQPTRQLAVTICAEYADVDVKGGEASKVTSCPTGDMPGGPARLPDELRKALKVAPPADVVGVEAREGGWVGYSMLHYPTWALGDETFTAETLPLVIAGDQAVEPSSVALPIPAQLTLRDNRPIFMVLTGKNPYAGDSCKPDNELRLAMYVATGKVAARVLEWPAATCSLGRAMRFELSNDDNLTIGYTNGSTVHFAWSGDHFERSELGAATTEQ